MSSFINLVADHIKQHYDLQKEELTVVFPNKRAAFYLRSRFKEIYEGNIWMPQMLSIEEAVTQWSGLNIVDTLDLLFELIAIETDKVVRVTSPYLAAWHPKWPMISTK